MKNILTIIKKEFSRFFKDMRMIASIILPGLMIFIVYSIMGSIISEIGKTDPDHKFTAYMQNMPAQFSQEFDFLDKKQFDDLDAAKSAVKDGELDLIIIFPVDFSLADEAKPANPDTTTPATTKPDIRIFYNSSKDNSIAGYNRVCLMLEAFKMPKFSINETGAGDLAGEKAAAGKVLASFMPMVLFSLLASGCMAFTPEAIAGEKERGTLATMFITPIKRWHLAVGKVASLSCFATLSGLSSFIGLFLSLPKLMGGMISGTTATYYSFGDYITLFALIVSVMLVLVSAFSTVSAFAKSVKEAASLVAPIMIVAILMGVFTMLIPATATGMYAIPLLGSGLAFSAIMNFSLPPVGAVLAILSNLALAGALITLLSFMFKSEKIMFNK